MSGQKLNIVVTVGMGPWPFDRLLSAIEPLCAKHEVFAQTGTSTIALPCQQRDFVPYPELVHRMERADVVITHAGNTVRLVQRMGKVPLVVARKRVYAEMADDHQVEYLHEEERCKRVYAIWDTHDLEGAVKRHASARPSLSEHDLAPRADPHAVADDLDEMWKLLRDNPFRHHPLRRYAYAWEELVRQQAGGPHLDIGCGNGDFLAAIAARKDRECRGIDVHPDYIADAQGRHPGLAVEHVPIGTGIPYADASFASATLLDVLEHCPDDDVMLREVHRVLKPGGTFVLTVPAQHLFSFLDPDNVKFRLPRLHRIIYSARFGAATYHRRFVDTTDGLIGDMALGRDDHTNYRSDDLVQTLARHGFAIQREAGANRFWRLLHGPALLAGRRLSTHLDRAMLLDGRIFHDANLFLTLAKVD